MQPNGSRHSAGRRTRYGARVIVAAGAISLVPEAAAHEGTVHTSTPHWVLLATILVGLGIGAVSVLLGRTRWRTRPRRAVAGALLGLVVSMVGTIGVVQIQLEPVSTTPVGLQWYPLLSLVAGGGILVASVFLGVLRWPHRPAYTALGVLSGLWVSYPVLVPGYTVTHPLGYLLVLGVPLVVGYILRRDVWTAFSASAEATLSRTVGVVVASLFAVFFLFSAGLFSVNPETGADVPDSAFVTTAWFSDPLVVWPAIEFYLPAVPLFGALSVGTGVLVAFLASLVGVNAVLSTAVWSRDVQADQSEGILGAAATTGATACCCCGPAVYALASVLLGASASPLYWAFVAPSSPLGALFLVGSVTMLTASAVRLADALEGTPVCAVPPGR